MASIIPGYEYDIFISYRQKDNKGDRWVSVFVDALKTELESTFKEEISVYFDINTHDGLLETHDVDASLKDKLKCVIFIPIVSRTYCDPKSFAWEHEFKSFIEKASKDQSGLKVRLPNGNVANRILPIKINELDPEDKTLLENEIGGVLRSIEFIFMSAGVNRPLRANEDHPQENLNKTYYLDQINKVANAVKEIINAIKKHNQQHGEISKEVFKSKPEKPKNLKAKIIFTSIIILTFIVLGYFFIPALSNPEEQLEKSIAVLPFRNDSPNDSNIYFINGIMEKVLNNLQIIKDLRVISRTSVEQYRNSTKSIPEIGKELGVNYIVEGEGQKIGNKFSINAKLIRAKKENNLWSESFEREIKGVEEIFDVQTQIARMIADELKTTITSEENQLIEKTPVTNLTAYDFYQRGRDEYSKYLFDKNKKNSLTKAEDYYRLTLKYDSKFAQAYTGLARVFWDKHSSSEEYFSENYMDSVLILSNIALSLDNKLAEAYTLIGDYYTYKGTIQKAIDEYEKALTINPNFSDAYMGMGFIYEYDDNVKSIYNYQKAAALNHGLELPELLRTIAMQYASAGFPDKGKFYYSEALKLDGDSAFYYDNLGFSECIPGNYEKALTYLLKGYSIDSSNEDIVADINDTYMFQNKPGLSLKYFKNIDTLNFHRSFVFAQMHHIGWVLWENGRRKEADFFFNKQLEYSKGIIQQKRPWGQKLYPYFDMAEVYAFKGDKEKAYKYLNLFNQRQTMPIWILTYLRDDPLLNNIRNESAFQKIEKDIEYKYLTEHERVLKWLEKQGML